MYVGKVTKKIFCSKSCHVLVCLGPLTITVHSHLKIHKRQNDELKLSFAFYIYT